MDLVNDFIETNRPVILSKMNSDNILELLAKAQTSGRCFVICCSSSAQHAPLLAYCDDVNKTLNVKRVKLIANVEVDSEQLDLPIIFCVQPGASPVKLMPPFTLQRATDAFSKLTESSSCASCNQYA